MVNASPIGIALASVFGPISPDTSMLGLPFYYKYMYPLGSDACSLVAAWGARYEGRYSEVTHAARTVVEAFAKTVQPWGDDMALGLFPTPGGSLHHRTLHPQGDAGNKVNVRRLQACGLNLQFARDILSHDLGFLDLLNKCLAEHNWTNRPQGKLLAALSAQYLDKLALWLHGNASIETLEDRSPYWDLRNTSAHAVVVHRHNTVPVFHTGWVDTPFAADKYLDDVAESIAAVAKFAAT